jgi:hypothetical protein
MSFSCVPPHEQILHWCGEINNLLPRERNLGATPPAQGGDRGGTLGEVTLKEMILLVTRFVAGQAPSSYQVRFASVEACEAARARHRC